MNVICLPNSLHHATKLTLFMAKSVHCSSKYIASANELVTNILSASISSSFDRKTKIFKQD